MDSTSTGLALIIYNIELDLFILILAWHYKFNIEPRPKMKFYLFGIATRPTEKLAAQIILFAFQTIFFIY
jgi:hypothetical protein